VHPDRPPPTVRQWCTVVYRSKMRMQSLHDTNLML
jgi:hypothetical protein